MADTLTNLGVVDTGVSANQPLASSTGEDLLSGLMGQEAQIADLSNRKDASALDKLMSKRGLLAALLAGGAAAAGSPEAGLGIASGAIGGAQDSAAAENAAVDDTVEALQSKLDKMRTRLVQIYQTDPQALLTASGEDIVAPTTLGRLMTGMDLPVSPAAALQNRRRTQMDNDRIDFWSTTYEQADTPEEATLAARHLVTALDLNITDAEIETMGNMDESGVITTLLANNNLASESVLDAALYAKTNGLSILHPDALKLMGAAPPSSHETASAAKWNTLVRLRKKLDNYVAENPDSAGQPLSEQAAAAFEDSPGDLALFQQEYITTRDGESFTMEMGIALTQNISAKLAEIAGYVGEEKLTEMLGGRTMNEFIQQHVSTTIDSIVQTANIQQQHTYAKQRQRVRAAIEASLGTEANPETVTTFVQIEFRRLLSETGATLGDPSTYEWAKIAKAVDSYKAPTRKAK